MVLAHWVSIDLFCVVHRPHHSIPLLTVHWQWLCEYSRATSRCALMNLLYMHTKGENWIIFNHPGFLSTSPSRRSHFSPGRWQNTKSKNAHWSVAFSNLHENTLVQIWARTSFEQIWGWTYLFWPLREAKWPQKVLKIALIDSSSSWIHAFKI